MDGLDKVVQNSTISLSITHREHTMMGFIIQPALGVQHATLAKDGECVCVRKRRRER